MQGGTTYWRGIGWLLLVTLLVHLVLLLDSGTFWDGLLVEHLARNHSDQLQTWFYQAGLHPQYWLHRALFELPAPTWLHRFVSFGAVFGIGSVVHRLAAKHTSLTRWESLALACLVVAFPAYHVLVSITAIIYILPTFLLYAGWALYFKGAIESRRRVYEVAAYALMVLSYFHNSLLVFHYAFVVFAAWILVDHQRPAPLGARVRHALRRLWLVILIPVVFQVAKSLFFTPTGAYAGYNQIVVLHGGVGERLRLLRTELLSFWGCSSLTGRVPAALIGTGLVVALAAIGVTLWRLAATKRISLLSVGVVCLGAVFYAAAIFPYLVVGKSPEPGLAWTDRYAMQTPLGIALLVLGIARILGELIRSKQRVIEYVTLGAAFLFFSMRLQQHYLRWEERAAKDAAIVAALRDIPPPPAGTTFVWRDKIPSGDESYRFYELGSFMYRAWGAERWLAVNSGDNVANVERTLTPDMRAMYTAAEFTPSGCRGEIVVAAGHRPVNRYSVALAYLASSLSSEWRSRLEHELVTVELSAITCP